MLRKTIIVLLAAATVGLVSPTVASARGGHGGFHGGGFHGGGFHGGGFHHHGFYGRGFGVGLGLGLAAPYAYGWGYPYGYYAMAIPTPTVATMTAVATWNAAGSIPAMAGGCARSKSAADRDVSTI